MEKPAIGYEEGKHRVGTRGLSALLALAGGFLDGFTYVGHGHVFANAMTGNVVLLGIHCLSGSWQTGFRHLPAIAAFLVGICVAKAMQLHPKRRGVSTPYGFVLLIEISILSILSFLPSQTPDFFFTTLIAFAASVQVETFREVEGSSFSSTFTTGNLRTLIEAVFSWCWEGHDQRKARVARTFAFICFAFFVGAASGGYLTQAFGNRALWCDIFVFAVIALALRSRLQSASFMPKSRSLADSHNEVIPTAPTQLD